MQILQQLITKRFIVLNGLFLLTISLIAQIEHDSGYIVSIGDKAPDINLRLISGEAVQLSDLKGSVVVLQFTASWCSVCRKEMPHLENEVWLPNKDKGLILIGVDYDEPIEKVIEFKEQMKVTYPFALDPGAEIFAKFALKHSGVTRNVVINQDGKVAFLTRLFDKEEFEAMKLIIGELLSENP